MPAKAGIQEKLYLQVLRLDASLRWHDNFLIK